MIFLLLNSARNVPAEPPRSSDLGSVEMDFHMDNYG